MYEAFFGFTTRPFVAAPLVENYFPGTAIEQAHQTLARIIDRAEGPGLLVGPAGVGKTLLCRLLAERFRPTFQVAMLASTRLITRKALLQNILFELNLPYRDLEEGELRLSLLDHLQPSAEQPNGMLLIVDEAHTLALRLLEEIRMITNLVREGLPRVRLILAGGSKLEERFASPKLDSFNQRIAARCYLEPFNFDDTVAYVQTRLAAAGVVPQAIFPEDATRAIYQATDGIPRLVNQVCDHALVMAFAGGRQQIDRSGIEEAWADLQQLPGPWLETSEDTSFGSAIEFGELQDEPSSDEVVPELQEEPPLPIGEAPAAEPEPATITQDDRTGDHPHGKDLEQAHTVEPQETNVTGSHVASGSLTEELPLDAAAVHTTPVLLPSEPVNAEPAATTPVMAPPPPTPTANSTASAPPSPEPQPPAVVNPFGDDFDEEEVIIDHFNVVETEAFANRPQVSSAESRALASSLSQLAHATPEPAQTIDVTQANQLANSGDTAADTAASEPIPEPAAEAVPEPAAEAVPEQAADPAPSAPPETNAADSSMFEYTVFEHTVFEQNPSDVALERLCEVNLALGSLEPPERPVEETPAASPDSPAAATVRLADHREGQTDDRDMIEIEESAGPSTAGGEPPAGVEQVEYQQLFSQLRQS